MATKASPGPGSGTRIVSISTGAPFERAITPRTLWTICGPPSATTVGQRQVSPASNARADEEALDYTSRKRPTANSEPSTPTAAPIPVTSREVFHTTALSTTSDRSSSR